jgi:hypothetical protein
MRLMSEPKTRYQRKIEVLDLSTKPLTRYERFDRVLTTVLKEILAGSDLEVKLKEGKRISISLGKLGSWEFPTLEIGLRSIGDILESNIGAVTTIEGECPGLDLIDQELLKGSFLSVSAFSGKVKVCWIQTLPPQEFELKSGGSHRVTQKGVRTSIQEEGKILSLIRDALAVPERIETGTTLAHKE